MSNAVTTTETKMLAVESALLKNDISKLTPAEKQQYYNAICESVGLNPLTKPFAFLNLQGREVFYATKDCSEQLRKIHGVSTQIISQGVVDGLFEVHIKAIDKTGRTDEDFASIPLANAKGNDLANIKMKCVTKAKRRVTLSICGLGVLDESELDTISSAHISPASNPQIKTVKELFAKDESKPATPTTIVEEKPTDDLGQFVCRIGKKYAGQKLEDIDQFDLDNYVRWIVKDGFDNLKPDFKEFVVAAEDYLKSKESKTDPSFNSQEKMP